MTMYLALSTFTSSLSAPTKAQFYILCVLLPICS